MVSYTGKRYHTVYCPHAEERKEEEFETSFEVPYKLDKPKQEPFIFVFKFCETCDNAMLETLEEEDED